MRPRTLGPWGLSACIATLVLAVGYPASIGPVNAAAPIVIDLGSAGRFAVLAGDGIVDTGPSVIIGDVGTHPRPAVSSALDKEVVGAVHRAGATAQLAQLDLADGYDLAARATPGATVAQGILGGRTLLPGVYVASDGGLTLAGTVTLDGRGDPDAVWIIQAGSDLVTEPRSVVRLVNGARACNVFWQVAAAATLGAGSSFAGTILAMTSVAVGVDVTIDGRALARTARVTLAGDTITVPACSETGSETGSRGSSAKAPTGEAIVTGVAGAAAPPPSSVAPAPSSERSDPLPSFLPIVVVIAMVVAIVLGEPRRRRFPAPDGGW